MYTKNPCIASKLLLVLTILLTISCQRQQEQPAWLADSRGPQWPADWYFLLRNGPDTKFSLASYAAALADAQNRQTEKGLWDGFDEPWQVRGPSNLGGRINTIAVQPGNDQVIFLGFSLGGIWRTTDGGQQWEPVFDQQTFSAIGHIQFDPVNPNRVYAGTGDPNISGYPAIGDGLWRSDDLGESWTRLGPVPLGIISKVLIRPDNPNHLLVGNMGIPFERSAERGLYKSTDGGQSWQQTLFVSNQAGIIDLVSHPALPERVFAASWDRVRSNQESFVSGPNARIYRSNDGGSTWTPLTNGLPTSNQGRIGLCIAPSNPQHIYAMYVGLNSQLFDIFESNDGGDSWSSILATAGAPPYFDALGGFGWYFGKIRVSPTNEDELWLLGVDLWHSSDGGYSWNTATPPWYEDIVHADKHDLVFNAQGHILLGTDGGLSRFDNATDGWYKADNIPTNQVYRVAMDAFRPAMVFGGMQDNGSSGGISPDTEWPRIYGGDGFQMAFRPDEAGAFYAETQNGGIVVTPDDGANWYGAFDGIDAQDRISWDAPYFISPHNPDVLYTATYRVYRSDSGLYPNFSPISEDLTDGIIFAPRFHTITGIDESPIQEGLLYACTVDGNVWKRNPGGSWQAIHPGLPNRYVSSVKASPSQTSAVFVSLSGYRNNDFRPHIYRSNQGGQGWQSIAGDLPNLSINDLLVIPGYADSIIFAATDGGVYGTRDGGQHWLRLGNNMSWIPVYDLVYNPQLQELIAGTFGRSIQTYPLAQLLPEAPSSTSRPLAGSYWRVFPNPVQDQFFIKKQAGSMRSSRLSVRLYDARGRLQPISHRLEEESIQVDCRQLPPGVYFLQIEEDGGSTVEKIVIR